MCTVQVAGGIIFIFTIFTHVLNLNKYFRKLWMPTCNPNQ